MKRAALQRDHALVHEMLAAIDDPGALRAVLERTRRDRVDVVLVVLAQVRRERVRDTAVLADPRDRHGRVEPARERDADLLPDGERCEDP